MKMFKRLAALTITLPLLLGTQFACAESAETAPAQTSSANAAAKTPPPAPAPKPAPAATSTSSGKYQAGVHYEVLPNPARTLDPDKIEVMEVFWYGCSHCFTFEPLIHKWKESKPADVVFARTPAIWRAMMKTHARVYYAAEVLNAPDALHTDIFALLEKNPRQEDHSVFAQIFAKHGIDQETYLKTVKSFAVTGKISQAETRARKNYRVQGTPEMVVNGKYRTSGKMAGSQAGMLQVVNYLVELERKNN